MADKTADAFKFVLRLPKPLHKRLKQQARRNNASLNTEIVNQLEGSEAATAKRMAEALRPALDEAIKEVLAETAFRQTHQARDQAGEVLDRWGFRTEAELMEQCRRMGFSESDVQYFRTVFRERQIVEEAAKHWQTSRDPEAAAKKPEDLMQILRERAERERAERERPEAAAKKTGQK